MGPVSPKPDAAFLPVKLSDLTHKPDAAALGAEPEVLQSLLLLSCGQTLMLLLCMQSLNYTNSHATLLRDANRAASTLRTACSRRRSPELRMKPESLLTCEAVAFVQVGQAVLRAAQQGGEPVGLHGNGSCPGGAPL